MASNRKRRLPSAQRDVVTGEPLQYDTLRTSIPDVDATRHPLHRTPIPFRLHVSQEETVERDGTEGELSERLGSHALSKPMVHYIREGERSQRRQEKEWWRDSYVCQRLARHVGDKGHPFDSTQLLVALAWMRGEDMADWGYDHRYVMYAVTCVSKLAKTYTPRLERVAA